MSLFSNHTASIQLLCEKHHVKKLVVFGSAVTGKLHSASDIDLLVEFGEVNLMEYADNYFELKEELERIFNREVDLLEMQALKNPYLIRSIQENQMLLYAA